jgi:xanthine dehydrogenase molybdenum-binding subunit
MGPGGSRVTRISGQAALDGARRLKRALLDLAAESYGWPANQVELTGDRFVGGGESADFACAAALIGRGGVVEVNGSYETAHREGMPLETNTAAYAVEVEVDPETGTVRVLDALLVAAVGTIVNPLGHQGQLDGGFAFGLGAAFTEDLSSIEGRVQSLNLGEYKLPCQADMPPHRTELVRSVDGPGPFGAQSAGELTNIAVAPAIANAIAAATGARVTNLPMTAERVVWALRERPKAPHL